MRSGVSDCREEAEFVEVKDSCMSCSSSLNYSAFLFSVQLFRAVAENMS